jgi:hypothetical protein
MNIIKHQIKIVYLILPYRNMILQEFHKDKESIKYPKINNIKYFVKLKILIKLKLTQKNYNLVNHQKSM